MRQGLTPFYGFGTSLPPGSNIRLAKPGTEQGRGMERER